jgi:hypothetical protein
MSGLASDLLAVAAVNPVPRSAVIGEAASARANALREQLNALPDTTAAPPRLRLSRHAAAVAVAVMAILVVGTAIGARLLTTADVERYLPQGSAAFVGTDPRCTALEDGIAYQCRLARTPTRMSVTSSDGRPAFKGAKFATVNDESRVNGGCVGLNNDGTTWVCYLGERAVAEGILDQGVLGQTQAGPAGG